MSEEAIQRRHRSEEILRAEGVPVNEWLPVIETESEVKFRSTEQVAGRAMALCLVAVKGEGLLQAGADEVQRTVERIMGEFRTAPYLSAAERGFGFSLSQTHSKAIQFTWRYEAYWVMLWALGFVAKLARPDSQCDVARAVSILRGLGHDKFMSQAKLRPPAEVLDAADLIYRYHWAVREYHQLRGQEPPAKLNADVVMERHHALNWLIGYGNGDWDSVDTST